MSGSEDRLDLRRLLGAVEGASPISAVDVLAAELREMVDARHVSLLIANASGSAVMRLSHVSSTGGRDGANERSEPIPLPGSVHEGVLRSQELSVAPSDDGWLVLLPVTERGDAIGLLELSLPLSPDRETVEYLESAAHALAYVLIAARRHTDVFEWGQRDVPFSLAAEIQRRLLPSSYTIEAGSFALAGWLEPAATAGGDTFDYSLGREHLHASITDAMGHSNEAALLATLTVGSLRNSRRALASPSEQADAANAALLELARADQFVTGQVLRLGLADGLVELVNAGHPAPYLVRDGEAAPLDVTISLALGLGFDAQPYAMQSIQLEPGDRLVLVTDGFLERHGFAMDLATTLAETTARHPREVVRELADNVLRITGGALHDDATALCIDWYGAAEARDATSGASRARATSA